MKCSDCGKYGEGLVIHKGSEYGIGMPRGWSFEPSESSVRYICEECRGSYTRMQIPGGTSEGGDE